MRFDESLACNIFLASATAPLHLIYIKTCKERSYYKAVLTVLDKWDIVIFFTRFQRVDAEVHAEDSRESGI